MALVWWFVPQDACSLYYITVGGIWFDPQSVVELIIKSLKTLSTL